MLKRLQFKVYCWRMNRARPVKRPGTGPKLPPAELPGARRSQRKNGD